ncbi:MAG: PQQ-binding-like beta-propeller repeat protein [Pirellulaceae bacterium]|nr:PQQ-binding-like beta-propeller repeat protein [Pirellulaceae bacterium]
MKRFVFASCVITLATTLALPTDGVAETRTWNDISGKFSIQAEFVAVDGDQVQLKRESGQVVVVPLKRLSGPDQRWVFRKRRSATADNATGTTSPASTLTSAIDWPRWRGPASDGISRETGLLSQWPDDGPDLLWSSTQLGRGYSSLAIFDGKIITMGNRGGDTNLIAVSLSEGSPLWETPFGGGGSDPNCTPTIDPESKLAYGLSHNGILLCVNTDNGEQVWKKNFESDFGGRMMSGWGFSESPLIDGDRLICTPGSDQGVLVALDKRTGELFWKTQMPQGSAGYSSPVISNGGGVKQYVTLVGKGLIGVRASDGELLWHYPRIANSTANVPTPIVKGDYVFGSSGYGDGGSALLKLSPAGRGSVRFQEVYYKPNNEVQNHHGGMILIGDHIYMGHGHNNGLPLCMDMVSGRVLWGPQRGAGTGSAAIVAADGHLYFRYENAVMALIEATPSGYKLKGDFKIKSNNGKSWAHPVIADKKLFLRDQDELHCYDIAQ